MKFRINETGETKELNIIDGNRIDWTHDLIGNSGAVGDYIHYDEESEVYTISQDNFDWWEDYIGKKQADDDRLVEFRQEYDSNKIQEIIDEENIGDYDYDSHHDVMQTIFERIENELEKL